ncbi:MAG: hypothetical protein AB7Y46_16500 [Armatimonadota bacterium]
MNEKQPQSCCPMMDLMREWFPLVPIVFPILFPLLPAICVLAYIWQIGQGVRHIEQQLDEILTAVKRVG